MKRRISLLLALCLLITLFAACGSSDSASTTTETDSAASESVETTETIEESLDSETGTNDIMDTGAEAAEETDDISETAETEEATSVDSIFPLEENVVLTAWSMWIPGIEQYVSSPSEVVVFKAMEELTNVTIDMSLASSPDTAMTEINLLIASGSYPDLINNLTNYYSAGIDSAIEQEVIIDVLEYESLMPNYFEKLEEQDALDNAITEGGHIGVVYQINEYSGRGLSGLTLRQDWMEELGVDAPTTYDELHDLLLLFKQEYDIAQPLYIPKGGTPDTLFDGFGTELSYVLNAEMNTVPWNYVKTENGLDVVFGLLDDSYYDVLELLHSWYEDGIFTADYLNNNYNVDTENLVSGEFACLFASESTLNSGNTYQEHMWAAYPNVSIDGEAITKAETFESAIGGQGYSITTACVDVEIAAQWLDYQYTDDTYILNNYGIEGESFEYDENGDPCLTDLVMNNPDGIAQAYSQFLYLNVTGSFYLDNNRFKSQYCQEAKECNDIWKTAYDYYTPTYDTSAISLTSEEQEEYTQIFSDISTYCSQAIAEFITGTNELSETSFETFRNNLISMGIEDCEAIYQGAADRYVASLAE